jgi:DNA polymerase-3 subunit alpha/error-prone DNA polymerase
LFSAQIKRAKTLKAKALPGYINQSVGFAGWLITGKAVNTKQGDPMKFLTFEDETGILETVFFPRVYKKFCHTLDYGKPYFLFGRLESEWGAVTMTVESARQIH